MRLIFEGVNMSITELSLLCKKRTDILKDIKKEIQDDDFLFSRDYILELINEALKNDRAK